MLCVGGEDVQVAVHIHVMVLQCCFVDQKWWFPPGQQLYFDQGEKTVQNNSKKKKKHAHTRNFPTLFADVDYVKLLLQLAPGEIWLLQQWLTVTGQIGCHYTAINKQTSICILLLLLPECLTGITIVVFAVLPWIYNELRIVISIVFVCVDLICR